MPWNTKKQLYSSRSEYPDIENRSDADSPICHLAIFDIVCLCTSSKNDKFQFFGDFCHGAISPYLILDALVNRQISLKIHGYTAVRDSSNRHGIHEIHGYIVVNVMDIRHTMKKKTHQVELGNRKKSECGKRVLERFGFEFVQ